MEAPEIFKIGAPFSGKIKRRSYIKQAKSMPNMTKRDKKALEKIAKKH